MGFVRDFTGLALARGNPAVPGVAHTNPVRDKTGHSGVTLGKGKPSKITFHAH